ncbi:MAG: asparagine synthase (glutamine-hydrolyzing) [Chitinophagaceae bacterium]|nr:MAG: asparagine synthase [Bacteroidetes bacterium OLB11]MCC6448324.1 asparagine synthase (glutamine-hydrolyzing) [Chitinophagaceae bacterium]HMN31966.1 asparagine synthase (glutamine-hydrolyzing) [Chitinophagaceae bacterium]
MCGIAGFITSNPNENSIGKLKKMTDVIAHRGPDGEGHWISENGKVGLGHRRLSIIDLSQEANQPMHYMDRYSIVFNGEIYNFVELRENLQKDGYQFHTHSDTEVLMAMYDKYKADALKYLDGMFAFVLYDKKENTAFCVRDRFGEKPFFYNYKKGEYFSFGSEMKCLWAGGTPKVVNNRMLFNYLSFGYLDNPNDLSETFYENCTRLHHSHYILVNIDKLEIQIHKYYDIEWQHINHQITIEQAKEKFHELFYTSVSRRLRSDVPVGSSLSGGLDSSLVVSVVDKLKEGTSQKQSTFSAVFPGFKKDERKFMDYVIEKTNVSPNFITPSDEGLIEDIESLSFHQEEPYGSASIYAQYCVMKLAKQNNVTVLLDGQGADEILAGYHFYYNSFFNELKNTNQTEYQKQLEIYKNLHQSNSINGITKKTLGDRVRAISPSLVKPIKGLRNQIKQLTNPVFNSDFYNTYSKDVFETKGNTFSTLNESLYNSTYRSGSIQQLLRYADRNSMAHSREVRLPFLSHELVEFLFTLPAHYKIHDGWTKWIMRETFDILPEQIRWRKDKIGYEPPQKSWMENPLIIQKIKTGRNKLVENNILNKKILQRDVKAEEACMIDDNSWGHLLSDYLL